MSSFTGQPNNFPFGYNPDSIHGVGLPDFITPGPPPGQPLLNDNETHDLSSFFTDFESNDFRSKPTSCSQFQDNVQMTQNYDLPPTFVGSETSYGLRSGVDPHQLQMSGYNMYNGGLVPSNVPHMNPENSFEQGMHHQGNSLQEPSYPHQLLNQLQSAANSMPDQYGPSWPPHFPPQNMVPQMMPTERPMVRFGSDSHFQNTHYDAPNGQMEPEIMSNLDWIEAQSSATNTQPNTQPSSPYLSKKRKLDDYVPSNGFPMSVTNGHSMGLSSAQKIPPNTQAAQKKRRSVKQEQLPTPTSTTKSVFQPPVDDDDDDEDKDQDDDDDDQEPSPKRSASPEASWPKNKARPFKSTKPPAPSKPKKSSKKAARPAKPERTTSISARTPLTAEQKKANHTNSEQRRRDATAKAYAELYDLVPELEGLGKQSTMKKLEVVVNSLKLLKEGNETLRNMFA